MIVTYKEEYEMHDLKQDEKLIPLIREGNTDAVVRVITEDPSIDLRAVDKFKWAPLHWAVWHNYLEIARFLLETGIKRYGLDYIEQKTGHGVLNGEETPLILAAKKLHMTMIFLLIDFGASFEAKDQNGKNVERTLNEFNPITTQLVTREMYHKKVQDAQREKIGHIQSEFKKHTDKNEERIVNITNQIIIEKGEHKKFRGETTEAFSQIESHRIKNISDLKDKLQKIESDIKDSINSLEQSVQYKLNNAQDGINQIDANQIAQKKDSDINKEEQERAIIDLNKNLEIVQSKLKTLEDSIELEEKNQQPQETEIEKNKIDQEKSISNMEDMKLMQHEIDKNVKVESNSQNQPIITIKAKHKETKRALESVYGILGNSVSTFKKKLEESESHFNQRMLRIEKDSEQLKTSQDKIKDDLSLQKKSIEENKEEHKKSTQDLKETVSALETNTKASDTLLSDRILSVENSNDRMETSQVIAKKSLISHKKMIDENEKNQEKAMRKHEELEQSMSRFESTTKASEKLFNDRLSDLKKTSIKTQTYQHIRSAEENYTKGRDAYKKNKNDGEEFLKKSYESYQQAKNLDQKIALPENYKQLSIFFDKKSSHNINPATQNEIRIHYICAVFSKHVYPIYDIRFAYSDRNTVYSEILKEWKAIAKIDSLLFVCKTNELCWEIHLSDAKKVVDKDALVKELENITKEIKKDSETITEKHFFIYNKENVQKFAKEKISTFFDDKIICPRLPRKTLPSFDSSTQIKEIQEISSIPIEKDSFKSGYFAAAYKVTIGNRKLVIIAHCGTVVSENGDLAVDILMSFNLLHIQFALAREFTMKVLTKIQDNKDEYKNHTIYHTGHSLGAILAEVSAMEHDHHYAVTFESPGSYDLLERFNKNHIHKALDRVTTYLAAPNFINTLKPHIGKCFQILTKDSDFPITDPNEIKKSIDEIKNRIDSVKRKILNPGVFTTSRLIPQEFKNIILEGIKFLEKATRIGEPLMKIILRDIQSHNMDFIIEQLKQVFKPEGVNRREILQWPIGPVQYFAYVTFIVETGLAEKPFNPDTLLKAKSAERPLFDYLLESKSIFYDLRSHL